MSASEEVALKDVRAVLDRIEELFERRGNSLYGGEAVTQTEHALQAAMAAEQEGAGSTMIAAALLHDLGHLLHNLPETAAEQGIDDRHEDLACRWLVRYFGPELTEPIRLHVAAKRYLCATDPEYMAKLSDASKLSLHLQGGPFRPEEAEEFERGSHFESAVRLRRWDDIAKVRGLSTPDIQYFRRHLEAAAGI